MAEKKVLVSYDQKKGYQIHDLPAPVGLSVIVRRGKKIAGYTRYEIVGRVGLYAELSPGLVGLSAKNGDRFYVEFRRLPPLPKNKKKAPKKE